MVVDSSPATGVIRVQRQPLIQRLRRRLVDVWASFDAQPRGRRVPGTLPVAFAGALVVLVTGVFVTTNGWALAFPDAQSHLTISRRIFDSLAPGFTQLGTVWLPLPTISLIPFVVSLPLWASGWGGVMLGAICLAGTTASCYRIAARIGLGRAGRLTAPLLLITNPSMVYQHTTAMTEPVLILFLTATTAGLASWAMTKRPMSAGETMVFCGLPAAGALLSRYEGWAMIASGTLFIVIVAFRRYRPLPRRERFRSVVKPAVAFLFLPALGLAWWISYNFVVYGDPLEFLRGPYSAGTLHTPFAEAGLLAYKGFLGLTLWSYHWAVIGTAGAVTAALAVVGLVVATGRYGLDNRAGVLWLLATGWAFSLLSLYLGQSLMNNMHTLPPVWLNNRYALVTAPWLGLLIGVLVDWLRSRARAFSARSRPDAVRGSWGEPAILATTWILALALVAQGAWMMADLSGRSAVLAEGREYLEQKAADGSNAAATFLREHYDGGLILMDEAAGPNALLPQIGIPLREYLNRSTGELFTEALADPQSHARWLLYTLPPDAFLQQAQVSDSVYARVTEQPAIAAAYETVFHSGQFVIAKRAGS